MSVQVIVKHSARSWDAISTNNRSALYRVAQHMVHGHDVEVAHVGVEILNLMLFGGSVVSAKELLEAKGFEVTIKELNQGEQ